MSNTETKQKRINKMRWENIIVNKFTVKQWDFTLWGKIQNELQLAWIVVYCTSTIH